MPTHHNSSLLSGGIREGAYAKRMALLDEIEKISEDQAPKSDPKWKRIGKSALGYSAGYAAGHAGGMIADAAARRIFKNKYPQWTPAFKQRVLYPLLGLSMVGVLVGQQVAEAQRAKMLKGDE